jgi:hypothetical protein
MFVSGYVIYWDEVYIYHNETKNGYRVLSDKALEVVQ